MPSFVRTIANYFVKMALSYGVMGLGVGMFVESVGIPGASAVLELTSGFLIARGRTSFWEAWLISTAGLTAGSLLSYGIGYVGAGQVLKLARGRLQKEEKPSRLRLFVKKYGAVSILVAQFFGTTRTWISIPAGAMKMNLKKFMAYTALGGALYCALAIGLSIIITRLVKEAYKQLIRFIHIPFWTGLVWTAVLGAVIYFLVIKRMKSAGNNRKDSATV